MRRDCKSHLASQSNHLDLFFKHPSIYQEEQRWMSNIIHHEVSASLLQEIKRNYMLSYQVNRASFDWCLIEGPLTLCEKTL